MDNRKVILVAEDQVIINDLIQRLLCGEGYEVLAAADGYEALELSRTHPGEIDLFLTDVEMPKIDGISAYRQISIERPEMKALFISGGRLESELPEPWPFLSKPFKIATLLSKVNELLITGANANSLERRTGRETHTRELTGITSTRRRSCWTYWGSSARRKSQAHPTN